MLDGEWHAFLEEGTHVSECDLALREASVAADDPVCVRPAAMTHRDLLAGSDRAARAPGLGALATISRGARVVVPNRPTT